MRARSLVDLGAQLGVVHGHRELRELAITFCGGWNRMPAWASASIAVSL
jgi:hypothetical protein